MRADSMKLLVMMILLGLLCWTPAGGSVRPNVTDPHMTAEERAKVVKLLLDTQKELLDATENLSEAQWSWRPAPFRWSVGLTAEHIMLAEGLLFSQVQRAVAQKPNPDWEQRTATKLDFLE